MKIQSLTIALCIAALCVGCNKKDPATQVKSNNLPKAATAGDSASAGAIAVVDIDSLAAKCEYCKDGQKSLEAKQKSFQQQLQAKGQALQNAMVSFQQKAQSGSFTSQQQAEAAQKQLEKQQQQLQAFQQRIENEMTNATKNYQAKLRLDISAFLQEYNKDGRFKVIISRSGDNVLYVDPAVDITNDVIAGLNKSYKK